MLLRHLYLTTCFQKCSEKKERHIYAVWHQRILSFYFTQKMPGSPDSMCSSIFILENIWLIILAGVDWLHKIGLVPGTFNWTQIHNLLWIQPTSSEIKILTLIWVGFLRVRFEVGGGRSWGYTYRVEHFYHSE